MEPGSSSPLQSHSRFSELIGVLIAVATLALPVILVSQTAIPEPPSSISGSSLTTASHAPVP
jgi:hypothetical protein